jgi:hypothetical protein
LQLTVGITYIYSIDFNRNLKKEKIIISKTNINES